ncbi:acid protease [Mycena latifolia]|nr:acid protease [Mycena latifolia]
MPNFVIKALPFTTRVTHGAKNILAADQARARKLLAGLHPHGPVAFHSRHKAHHHHRHHQAGAEATTGDPQVSAAAGANSVDVTDAAVTYTMSVGVGSPATDYTLLIDTGSSNTWIGADTPYKPTSTSTDTRNTVSVSYGSGSFTGTEYTDQVTLGPGLVIQKQSIGVSSKATGFNDVDGILGIGPVDLTTSTVASTTSVPTVTDNLLKQGTIPVESIGISYVPTTSATSAANGELTFGGTDSSKFTGDISYVPITSTAPASNYWGIDQTITYGTDQTILDLTAGIVDTGTTLLLIATDAFQAYQQATGATADSTTGLLTVTEEQFDQMQSLFFQIGDTTLELTSNAQIWPRSLNSTLGGDDDKIYLITADLGSNSGSGLDFIDGFGFLQRFYSVFDTTNSRVGFATTEFTDATTN